MDIRLSVSRGCIIALIENPCIESMSSGLSRHNQRSSCAIVMPRPSIVVEDSC